MSERASEGGFAVENKSRKAKLKGRHGLASLISDNVNISG